MYINHKEILFLMAFSTGLLPAVNTAAAYDFFKDPSARMHTAIDYVKKTIPHNANTSDRVMYAVQQTTQAGSVKELADLYAQLASATQLRTQQVLDTESQAAYIALVLEKLRISYYTQLDKLEAAIPYWQWAKDHTTRYTLSQLPHKWLSHEANKTYAERTYTTICGLREIYSAEFGKIIRLLGQWHEEKPDSAVWLAEVHTVVAGIFLVDPKDLSSIELLIKKLAEHEQQVVGMVSSTQAPNWVHQHWISLAAATVVVGAAAYYYYNNQQAVHGFVDTSKISAENLWEGYFLKPFKNLKNTLVEAMKPIEQQDETQLNTTAKNFKVSEQALEELEKTCGNSRIIGWEYFKQFTKPFFDWLRAWNNVAKDITQNAQAAINTGNKGLHANQINFALGSATPACFIIYGVGSSLSKIYNWFTKRDRSTLVGRLDQTEKVLIRTTHARELSDAEYGRVLYLLTKAYDQVAKNVFSKERAPFLDDLTYVADNQSSIEQKKMTLDSMWRKYRSLERAA